jgi:hypothetical protein
MAETCSEDTAVDLSFWMPGARFFHTSDDQHFIVDADLTDYPENGPIRFIRRNTSVLYCTAAATVTDMIPDHIYPPGTTAEEAIALLGYQLTTGTP